VRSVLLPEGWRKLLLAVHVAASVGVLGADLGLLVLGVSGVAGADPTAVYPAAFLIGARLVTPLAVTALATGLALGLLTQWGLFTYWWVTIKLGIVLILTGAVLFVLVPGLERTAIEVTSPSAQPLIPAARLPLAFAPAAASALLAIALLLAIFKPNWRIRRSKP
jgi:hypothetical protein